MGNYLHFSLLLCLPLADVAAQQESEKLSDKLTPLIEKHDGTVGVFVKNLKTGQYFGHRENEVMATASLCKLGVMVTAYRRSEAGTVDLNQKITVHKEDMVPGSGILTQHFSAGATISLRDAIRLMIVYSDNTATNLVTNAIGLKTTSDEMTAIGFPETKIHSQVYRRGTSVFPERSKKYSLGSTTAFETVGLLEQLQNRTCATEPSCKAMLEHLLNCDDDTKIAAGLPQGTRYANKTGAVSAIRCDAGLIFSPAGPIAICVLTNGNKDKRWSDDNAAVRLCADIGKVVFEHFNPRDRTSSGTNGEPLRTGAFGEMVEMLQRTLNARLSPSPELSVDGDFGPATETAVRRFQEANKLEATGLMNRGTWQALGTLVPEKPQPDPAVVNSQSLPRRPADSLDGLPMVTCRSFAIVDASSGKVLFEKDANKPLEPASTTKTMTAWLVAKLAADNPAILDEVITFSERADLMRGSTSGLRTGEKISVREALFGLMLPSGNDMSIAIAEHFGSRLVPADDKAADPFAQFVAAMNREAARLNMTSTHFENPHGWPHEKHLTTARDLTTLARVAWSNELFRNVVQARQRGVTVEGANGYSRNVVWKNSNQLLRIEGYDGIKTGTTTNAGACLISTAERNGRRLIICVLGSTSGDARYVDTRNLFRYAWNRAK
jgi:D-alanyl-D-alanine carboxypeptidase (penicillin-binding protein 5/6)